jgi:putative peptide zinc metalloprotease protein
LWVPRGTAVGEIVDDRSFEFLAVVSQPAARELFGDEIRRAEIRFPGEAGDVLAVAGWRVVPGRQDLLPSPALGWAGGGPVPVATDDSRGLHAAEPFFLLVARVTPNAEIALLHDRTGVIRFSLPPEPLLWQWFRALRQLVQQRYRI